MNNQNIRNTVDIIVVGGGVNGLVAAAYLAKSGKKVLLFEKKNVVGGMAVTEELIPGYSFSSLIDGAGYLSPAVISDLKLFQRGLEIIPVTPVTYSLQPDGNNFLISENVNETAIEIAKYSKADAESYPKFVELMKKISNVLDAIRYITPPDLPEMGFGNLIDMFPLLKPVRKIGRKEFAQVLRVMPMPIADLLNEWFESDIVKGAIAASSILNSSWGPQEAGTGFTFLYNWAGSNNGLFRSSGNIKGGMGAISDSIASAASALGVEIKTNSEVTKILFSDGVVNGVEINNGDQYAAKKVVAATNIKTTFLKLIDTYYLDQLVVKHVKNIKYRGTTARVHFVLKDIPQFNGVNGDAQNLLSGHIQISPTMTYIQKAFDPVKYGNYSKRPYLDIHIPSITDSSLSSNGDHIMSVTVKYMPYHLREGDWQSKGEEIANIVIDTISEYAPGFKNLIKEQKTITPYDLENDYDLPEGNYVHGEMTLDQFMWMRPIPGYAQYRTPIKNLYLCSAATHPGGGITGINGKNAAREILKDK